jgi:hypothetical protein
MRHLWFVVAALSMAACGNDSAKGGSPTTPTTTVPPAGSDMAAPEPKTPPVADTQPTPPVTEPKPEPAPPAPKEQPVAGHDFTETGKTLAIVGACHPGAVPEGYDEKLVAKHCKKITAVQTEYIDRWVKLAKPFFAERVPTAAAKKVVYPFSGGDLSTALTVYPDADEITTMSLEPAGDPRTLQALNDAATKPGTSKDGKATKPSGAAKQALDKALGTVQYELDFLYRVNFSNTSNMRDAMRSGTLPTQLIFSLSALKVHGYEIVSLRYFTLGDDGAIKYLADEDVTNAPSPLEGVGDGRITEKRNRIFSNSEIRFRKPGGKIQIHRQIRQDLSDKELQKDPRVVKHLEMKGPIVSMTKAASYLLSWDSFSTMRNYLIKNTSWMVSDATGVAPKWGQPAGFEYETYGSFRTAHLDSGNGVSENWRSLFTSQEKRKLPFRFGYYDKDTKDHLIIMKKKS